MLTLTQPGIARAVGASGLIRHLTLWGLLVPLALLAFVAAEFIGTDMVDAVNFLVYCLAAWVALALARLDMPGLLDRALWLSLAFFCLVFGASEVAGDMVENGTIANWPSWVGDVVCWALTGCLIVFVLWRRPQVRTAVAPVLALALAGFALHSLSLLVTVGEARLLAIAGIDPLRFDNLTDLIEFVCLELYLLAFIVLAMELSGRQALRAQVAAAVAAAEGAPTIRAAHLAFATATLTTPLFSRKRRRQAVLALGAGSGIGGWVVALALTRRLGATVERRSGKSPWRQLREQIGLMNRHRLAPKYYYMFELWRPEQARLAEAYIQRGETKGAAYKVLRRAAADHEEQRLSDKLEFHNRCRALGLATVPIVFAARDGQIDAVLGAPVELPPGDLFIKPRKGAGGNGASRWLYEAGPQPGYRGSDRLLRSGPALRAEIVARSHERGLIVQPRLANHPALADLNCGALATARVVTCRNELGGFEVTNAAFRMPRSAASVVDNFHAGGIAAAIDVRDGRLEMATDMGLNTASAWFSHHPSTGAPIEGRVLPDWPAVVELATRAHGHFDDLTVIGWDIAILADGLAIVEANGAPDLDIIQRTTRRPLGTARLGRLMSHHLKQRLGPVLLGSA